jgi:hypothetical protein
MARLQPQRQFPLLVSVSTRAAPSARQFRGYTLYCTERAAEITDLVQKFLARHAGGSLTGHL